MVNLIKAVKITVNSSASFFNSSNPVVIKNNPTIASGAATRLDNLTDVDATSETDKATLVYDSTQDKYIVKQLEFSDISGDLDGGTF
jgi:hypothetical protein